MSTSFAPIYNAFRKANIPEAEAIAAADAMTEAFANAVEQKAIKTDVMDMKRDIAVMKWMIGANLALSIAILIKLLVP